MSRFRMRTVDLRSDTITKPTDEMRDAMRDADVGDDYYGDDPTVKRLEAESAKRVGKEAALFVPSGTMANQIAIMVHSRRAGEIIAEQTAHIITSETGGAALLSGVMVRGIPTANGIFTPEQVRTAIRPTEAVLQPRTTLLCLENTHNRSGGHYWTAAQTAAVAQVAHENKVPVHIDGARIFNAAIAQEVNASVLAKEADSISFCFSKGLSAPFGSVICGTADFVKEGRRVRQILGGGLRQSGIMAAAALVSLDKMVDRLREDHANAQTIARGLAQIPGIKLDPASVQTNIVIFDVTGLGLTAKQFCELVGKEGVRCLPRDTVGDVRMVTNRHVTADDAKYVVEAGRRLFERTAAVAKRR